jgi:hypothetical protein
MQLDGVALAHANELTWNVSAERPEGVRGAARDRQRHLFDLDVDDDVRLARALRRRGHFRRVREVASDRTGGLDRRRVLGGFGLGAAMALAIAMSKDDEESRGGGEGKDERKDRAHGAFSSDPGAGNVPLRTPRKSGIDERAKFAKFASVALESPREEVNRSRARLAPRAHRLRVARS